MVAAASSASVIRTMLPDSRWANGFTEGGEDMRNDDADELVFNFVLGLAEWLSDDEREPFLARYRQTYGQRPPRLVTLAYDAVALAAVLAHQGHGYGRLALTAESGFAGRDGLFRLRSDGINQRGLSVYEVRPRDTRLLEPAPEVFPGY